MPTTTTTGSSSSQNPWWKPGTQPIEWQWMIDHAVKLGPPPSASDLGLNATTYNGPPAANPTVYDIDMFMNPASTIQALQSAPYNATVICYMDTGAYENYRPDASEFPAADIGKSTGWSGEYWLNTSMSNPDLPKLRQIMDARIGMAKSKGCQAIEPDQMDGWENNSGFTLTKADGENWDTDITTDIHAAGMSAGFKNQIEIAGWAADTLGADWALNEQCNQYSECNGYPPDGGLPEFIKQGKAVFQVEYNVSASSFCPAENAADYNGMLMPLNLNGGRTPCR
jgi:hypothetical protein